MSDEPRSTLARYAYGYSDKKPGWVFWLILVGMVVYVLYSSVTIVEAKDCLTKKEARREWPGHYLSWRGKHCWYSPKAEKLEKARKARAEAERLEEEKEPSEPESPSVSSEEAAPEPPKAEEGLPRTAEVLLFENYLERRLRESAERREVAPPSASPSPAPVQPAKIKVKNWKEQEISLPALLGFITILTGAVFVAGGLGLFHRRR